MHQAFRRRSTRIAATVIFGCMMIAALAPAGAVEVVDQSQVLYYTNFNPGLILHQTFRPALGNVSAIEVWIRGPGSLTIQLFDAVCGTVLGSGSIVTSVGWGWVKVNLSAPVPVTPEAEYAFLVTGTYPGLYGNYPNSYSRGTLYRDCAPLDGDWDLTFRTYSDDTLVPVASPVWGLVKHLYR